MIGQILFCVLFVALLIGIIVFNARQTSNERQISLEDERQREQDKQLAYNARLAEFRRATAPEWPHQFEISLRQGQRFLMVSEDRKRLRYVEVTHSARNFVNVEHNINVADIVSAELQQNSEVITSFETRSEMKKQGALGRALVGGVLLGGAGAVVGAASAGSKGSSTTTSTSKTQLGPVTLVIGTSDLAAPLIKIPTAGRSNGEEWLHRIRGCVAYLTSNQS